MDDLLKRLNYQGQKRILVKNADKEHFDMFRQHLGDDVRIDTDIDARFPYEYMIVFTQSSTDIRKVTPSLTHNLIKDGVLWFVYKTDNTEKASSKLSWQTLLKAGFNKKRIVPIDDSYEAMCFDTSD